MEIYCEKAILPETTVWLLQGGRFGFFFIAYFSQSGKMFFRFLTKDCALERCSRHTFSRKCNVGPLCWCVGAATGPRQSKSECDFHLLWCKYRLVLCCAFGGTV